MGSLCWYFAGIKYAFELGAEPIDELHTAKEDEDKKEDGDGKAYPCGHEHEAISFGKGCCEKQYGEGGQKIAERNGQRQEQEASTKKDRAACEKLNEGNLKKVDEARVEKVLDAQEYPRTPFEYGGEHFCGHARGECPLG